MGISDLVTGGLFNFLGKALDKLFPNPEDKAKAQAFLLQAQADSELQMMAQEMSVMLAEAKSPDKWTSRARPSFLYVVYLLLLAAIPMGIVYAVSPDTAGNISKGFHDWLTSLPPDIVSLFQWVMLGYIGGRSFEKIRGAAK